MRRELTGKKGNALGEKGRKGRNGGVRKIVQCGLGPRDGRIRVEKYVW